MNRKRILRLRVLPAFLGILTAGGSLSALTLRDTVDRALASSPGLAAAEASRAEASASAQLARDAFHPEAWASTTPGYSSGLPVAVAGRVPAIAGLDVRQTLYDRASRSEGFQADARAASQTGAAEKSRRETARSAALLYGRCWTDERRVLSARKRQDATEAILGHVEALVREGRRTELDLEKGRLEAARARQKTLDAESDRDLDFRELRIVVGAEPGSMLEVSEDPIAATDSGSIPVDAGRLRESDPELRALDLEIDSLRQSAASISPLSPVIEAEGQYSRLSRANGYDRYYSRFKADDWSVGISVAVPLWSGGRVADTRARLESRIAAAAADRRARRESLDLSAARAASALDRAAAAASLAERGEGVAAEALRISEALRREGRGDPDDVERRRIELSDGEEEALRARLEWLTARCELLSLSGDIFRLGR
jgi:outer membrane protein